MYNLERERFETPEERKIRLGLVKHKQTCEKNRRKRKAKRKK